ncbi:sialoadhesin isoform X2 [Salarias fasciatus]|uniref:Sialoadhesin-like n=1 Tax=Salarias fasciatus TaxID=181472 RepID=A0A672FN38_SALFA|nr:sialoadhesin-like isoform X2 [Salarias fasciatus]
MKMPGGAAWWRRWLLLALSLKGVLAGDWSVHLPSGPICAEAGSSVVLPCSFDYPQSSNETGGEGRLSAQDGGGVAEQQIRVLSAMWCLENSRCVTPRYVFHSAGIFPEPSYQNRVQYLGQPGTNNCSLMLSDLRPSDSGNYVFYLVTSHPTEKMPEQSGIQLLVSGSGDAVTVLASPSGGISEGGAVSLACCSPAAAGPQAVFTWRRGSSLTHSGQVWKIAGATSDHSGSYYCQTQEADKVQKSSLLSVDVQYSPRNTTVSVFPPGELQDSLPATLTCSSSANPPVHTFTWYRGAACLPTADRSLHRGKPSRAAAAGSGLSNASITVEEYGQHCCVARNAHGSQTSSVVLRNTKASVVPSVSAAAKVALIAVAVGVLLAVIAIAVCFISRRRKSSRHQSYVLTATTSTQP